MAVAIVQCQTGRFGIFGMHWWPDRRRALDELVERTVVVQRSSL
jgi:hypothetical protein